VIALDTNVIVRFLTQDEPEQSRLASETFESLDDHSKGFVCREVLLELVWVLERAYGYSRTEIAAAVNGLLSSTELVIESANDVGRALELYRSESFGFADLMIAAAARRVGAKELITFDRKAARLPGVRHLGR
jgi:predicted nucleic-acid-binding protein